MGEHHEVMHERLYLKEPRTERLRRSSAARLRYLLATGWRETERWHAEDYITVKVERSGYAPRMTKLPKIIPPPPRPPRQGFGDRGSSFGQRGPRGGGGGRGRPAGPAGPAGPEPGSGSTSGQRPKPAV
jgi:hypothetical protein